MRMLPEIIEIFERERDRAVQRAMNAEEELRMARRKRNLPEEPKSLFTAKELAAAIEVALEADRQQRRFGKHEPKRYTLTGRDPASEALRNREAWHDVQRRADEVLAAGGPPDRPLIATILRAAVKARG